MLVRGEKGTAKSTMVRALAAVLPGRATWWRAAGSRATPPTPDPACPDGPHAGRGGPREFPLDLPRRATRPAWSSCRVGASEDRLLGALDIERALTEGVKAYEPGLLAAAHRGVLYVDEVNLLHDHLVDLLLDAAALGISYVERDGVSVRHAARFLLVGTMNPEEGELRPQLLDRFGLTVEAAAPRDPGPRAEVVRRRLDYDADPAGFRARWQEAETGLAAADRGGAADAAPGGAAGRRAAPGGVGVRARSGWTGCGPTWSSRGPRWRTRRGRAGWKSAPTTSGPRPGSRCRTAGGASRSTPRSLDEQQLDEALAAGAADDDDPDPGAGGPGGGDGPGGPDGSTPPEDLQGSANSADPTAHHFHRPHHQLHPHQPLQPSSHDGPEARKPHGPQRTMRTGRRGPGRGRRPAPAQPAAAPGATFRVRRLEVPGVGAGAEGRRSRRPGIRRAGHRGAAAPGPVRQVHLTATLTAAAPYQVQRGRTGPGGLRLRREDLREARREGREGNLILFLVDASGSMAARARMGAVKGAVLSLLLDAYQRRDKVGLITFRGSARAGAAAPDLLGRGRRGPAGRRCRPAAAPRSPPACCARTRCCGPSGSATRDRRPAARRGHRRPRHGPPGRCQRHRDSGTPHPIPTGPGSPSRNPDR